MTERGENVIVRADYMQNTPRCRLWGPRLPSPYPALRASLSR